MINVLIKAVVVLVKFYTFSYKRLNIKLNQ
mgnify:CR=1 FL=1